MPVQRRGMRALLIWCQRVTSDYSSKVKVTDLSTSFRDGLAFCAIIHHFRPDLIPNFNELKSSDIYENNDLAYKIAENQLGIPSLLDPQDMVDSELPDKFSVVTYVSQFYHLFKNEDGGASPNSSLNFSRNSESENDSVLHSSSENTTPLGTPTITPKRLPFKQSDLIEKYGADIFTKSPTINKSSCVSRVCEDFKIKAKIAEEKES